MHIRDLNKVIPILLVLVVCSVFFSRAVHGATYTVSELLPTPLDVAPVTTTIAWDRTDTGYPNDDDKVLVNIGFPFTFKDVAYNQVRILTNGVLHFGANQRFHRVFNNVQLPTGSADRFIAPYWDDLVDDSQSSVTYGTKGSAPSRSFIVTWNNVRAYSNNLRYDFQVVLYENGDIRFRYDNNTANGASATIGIEVDNSDVIQYSYNSSSVRTDFDLFFRNSLLNLPDAEFDMRMDEIEWTGAANEVLDASANGLHGTIQNGLMNSDSSPALAGNPGTCRYGEFNGANQYINIPDNNVLDMTSSFTVSAWIKIDSLPGSGLKTILSKDENYEFHVKPNGTINWWWQTSSPGATRQFDSTGSISPGVWTHIAIRHQANNQSIFINGQASGSATFTGSPIANSDPLQIGADQGAGNREFNGNIDEVRIFSEALSDAQMITLASETHFCRLANPGCSAAFPDALSSYNDGILSFLESGNDVNSPDNVLQFSAISPSSNSFCNGANCVADAGNPVSEIDFGTFPDTSAFTQDFTLADNNTGTLGSGGQQQYDTVSIGQSATMGVNASVSTYYIDRLTIGRSSTINLRSGDYWVKTLEIERDAKLNVVGGGTARLFIQDDASFERNIWFNPNDGFGLTGDTSQLLLYAEGDVEFDRNTRFWGGIFVKGDLLLARDALYEGGITANNINIARNTTVNYDATGMANLDFGSLCQSDSCSLGSFEIIQPSVALACPQSRASVSFQAMCDDNVTVKSDYAGVVNLSSSENSETEFYLNSSGGAAVSTLSLTESDNGAGTVYLFHQNENSDLRVSIQDQDSLTSSTAASGTDFRSAGFHVSSPSNFSCGNTESISLSAIGQSENLAGSCSLLTGFTGNKALSAWVRANYEQNGPPVTSSPATPVLLDGIAISNGTQPASTNLSVNFAAGQATLSVAHLDAAQILSLEFAHDDGVAGTPELRGSSGSFVVYPDSLAVSAPAASSACVSGDETCSAFVAAGVDFDLEVEAICADPSNSTATSYQTAFGQSISLGLNLVAPLVDGVNGSLSVTDVSMSAADGGQRTIVNQQVSEVGVFTISAQAPSFFAQAIPATSSVNIGRFVPQQFLMTISSSSFAPACGSFSYLDQEFFFGTAPSLRIMAVNNYGNITQNYEGDFWKLGSELREQGSCNGVSSVKGFCYSDIVAGAAGFRAPNSSQSYGGLSDINGELNMTLHNQSFDAFSYQRSAGVNIAPFDADIGLTIELLDQDGVAGTQTLPNIGFAGDSDAGGVNFNANNDLLIRQGRWKMENAYGPETQALAMEAHAQYFSLLNRYELNADDSCTNLPNAVITLNGSASASPVSVASGSTSFTHNAPLVLGEDKNFSFSSPGAGNIGSVDVEVDLSAYPWLQYDWNQDGSLDNHPSVKATFGQYRGHDRIIYWRELSN